MKIFQFFQEDNGNLSSARLLAFGMTCGFLWDYGAHIMRGADFDPTPTIVATLLGIVGAKVAQKFGEQKVDQPK